jgi:hypothetical protein
VGWAFARNDLGSGHEVNAKRSSEGGVDRRNRVLGVGRLSGRLRILVAAWGTLEGSARLFQPIVLGLIAGVFISTMVVAIYRGLSYLLD